MKILARITVHIDDNMYSISVVEKKHGSLIVEKCRRKKDRSKISYTEDKVIKHWRKDTKLVERLQVLELILEQEAIFQS